MNRHQRRAQASMERKAAGKLLKSKKNQLLLQIKEQIGLAGITVLFKNYPRTLDQFTVKELEDVLTLLVRNGINQENVFNFKIKDRETASSTDS